MLISRTIDSALRKIGVLSSEDEASASDHQLGLDALNRIIDSYNTQNLLITYLQDIAYEAPYTVNECETADPDDLTTRKWKSTVTIGRCKDINTEAPIHIEGAFFRQGVDTDFVMKSMTHNQYSSIGFKNVEAIPYRYYVQRLDNNDVSISFDVIPQDGLELHIQAKMPYTGKNSTGNEYLPTDDINWGVGFEKMLMYRLAVELAPDFEVDPSPIILSLATEAENNLMSFNHQPMVLKADRGLSGRKSRFNTRTNRARY